MPPQVAIAPESPSPPTSDEGGASIDDDNVSTTSSVNNSTTTTPSATNSPLKKSVRLSGKVASVAAAFTEPVQKMSKGGARAVSSVATATTETVKHGAKAVSSVGKSGAKAMTSVGKGGARAVSNVAFATSESMQRMGKHSAKTVSNVASHGAKTMSTVATTLTKPVQSMGNHLMHRRNQDQQEVHEDRKSERGAQRRHQRKHRERKNSEDSSDRRSRRSSRTSVSSTDEAEEISGEFDPSRRKKKPHHHTQHNEDSRQRTKSGTEADLQASIPENFREESHQDQKDQEEHQGQTLEGEVHPVDEHAKMSRRSSWYNPTAPWETEEDEIQALQHLRTLPTRTKSCDAVMQGMIPDRLIAVQRKKKKRLAATARHNAGHEADSDDEDKDEPHRGGNLMSSMPTQSLSRMLSASNFDKDGNDDDEHSISSWCNIDTSDSEWEENEDGSVQQCPMVPPISGGSLPKRPARPTISASILSNAGLLDDDASEEEGSEEELLFSAS